MESQPEEVAEHCQFLKEKAEAILNIYTELATKELSNQSSHIQRIIKASLEISNECRRWISHASEDQVILVDFLLLCSQRLRQSVHRFVKASNESMENSMDFLTEEKRKTYGKEVFRYTASILSVVKILKQSEQTVQSTPNTGTKSLRLNLKPESHQLELRTLLWEVNEIAKLAAQVLEIALGGDSEEMNSAKSKFKALLRGFQLGISKSPNSSKERLNKLSALVSLRAEEAFQQVTQLRQQENTSEEIKNATMDALRQQITRTHQALSEELLEIVIDVQKYRNEYLPKQIELPTLSTPKSSPSSPTKEETSKFSPNYNQQNHHDEIRLRTKRSSSSNDKKSDSGTALKHLKPRRSRTSRRKSLPESSPEPVLMEKDKADSTSKLEQSHVTKLELPSRKSKTVRAPKSLSQSVAPKPNKHLPSDWEEKTRDLSSSEGKKASPKFPGTPPRMPSGSQTSRSFSEKRKSSITSEEEDLLEASLVAAIPLFVEEFRTQFPWFAKGWAKESAQNKQIITNTLQKQLQHLIHPDSKPPPRESISTATFSLNFRRPSVPISSPLAILSGFSHRDSVDESETQHMSISSPQEGNWSKQSDRSTERTFLSKGSVPKLQASAKRIRINFKEVQQLSLKLLEQPSMESKLAINALILKVIRSFQKILRLSNSQDQLNTSTTAISSMKDALLRKLKEFSPMELLDNTSFEAVRMYPSKTESLRMCHLMRNHILRVLTPNLDSLSMQLVDSISSIEVDALEIEDDLNLLIFMICRSTLDSLTEILSHLSLYSTIVSILYRRSDSTTDLVQKANVESKFILNSPRKPLKLGKIWENGELFQNSFDATSTDLNQLIRFFTTPDEPGKKSYTERMQFETIFFTTFRQFASSYDVVQTILDRYNIPSFSVVTVSISTRIKLAVYSFLIRFIKHSYSNFQPKTLSLIQQISTELGKDGFTTERQHLNALLAEMEAQSKELESMKGAPDPGTDLRGVSRRKSSLQSSLNHSALVAYAPKDVAEQLTLIDSEIFYAIQKHELLSQAWNKDHLKHTAPNVVTILSRLNKVSYWVPSMILMTEKVQQRAKIVSWFIDIAINLHQIGNYSSLMGIVAGLSLSSIDRLNFTWSCVQESKTMMFKQFVNLLNPSNSYKFYRSALASTPEPNLPYLGVSLIDLTFIDEGNPSVRDGMINFQKQQLVSKILTEIEHRQQSKYSLKPSQPLLSYLSDLPHLETNDLYTLSMIREPRGADIKSLL